MYKVECVSEPLKALRKMMPNSAAHTPREAVCFLNFVGKVLDDRFKVERRIGVGSYAEIYLARDLTAQSSESVVIVKALNLLVRGPLEPDLERTLIENFALEARTMQCFDHENIVRLFGSGRALDNHGRQFDYLVLEYMPGGSLSQFVNSRRLPFEKTLDYTNQLCEALSYAHAERVLHRDVKPSNIMMSLDRRKVKLIDFGAARLLDADGSITRVGTDLYAAPEHYSLWNVTENRLTPAADVYSLAKTVYYMLSGTSPASFKQRQITSVPAHLVDPADGVLRVLRKATSESPPARHQSVQEFYEDLAAISELTLHSPNPRNAVHLNARTESRVVIEIEPEPTRCHLVDIRRYCVSGAKQASRLARFTAQRFGRVWRWAHPGLRRGIEALTAICRHICLRLIVLPYRQFTRIAAVALLSLVLLVAMPFVLKWLRSQRSSGAENDQRKTNIIGTLAIAGTDINIRAEANGRSRKIGLVERGSLVRILSCGDDQKWCEVEVIQHARTKKLPSSADTGWVSRRYLKLDE